MKTLLLILMVSFSFNVLADKERDARMAAIADELVGTGVMLKNNCYSLNGTSYLGLNPSDVPFNQMACLSSVIAVSRMLGTYDKHYCRPEFESNILLGFTVLKYLKNHPSDLRQDGNDLVRLALLKAYPCKGDKK